MRFGRRAAAIAATAVVLVACGAENGTDTDADTGGDPGIDEVDETDG